ncbi:DUF3575 domain-containing protein [Hymenobacter algoricola]
MRKSAVALLFCFGTLPVVAGTTQPDTTTARPGRHHSLKLGLHSSNYAGTLPTLGYEWTLGRHLSLQTSASYYGSTWRNSYSLVNDDNTVTSFSSSHRERRVTGQVQARYYFQRHTPALVGWYAGLGLSTTYTYAFLSSDTQPAGTTTQSLMLQPQLRLGRQWALGQRFLLDTYVGLDMNKTPGQLSSGRRPWIATPAAGFQLGYRF